MHVEVRLYLASFLLEQRGEEKARSETASEGGEQSRSRAGPMRPQLTPVLCQQVLPDLDVLVLDLGQPEVQRLLVRVVFSRCQHAIQERGIGLVLPVVLEGVQIRR